MKIVAATQNKNKIREFREIFPDAEIISQRDAGIDIDVVEDGTTFLENAGKKARAIFDATGLPSLADDSGLCVDALGGEPGIYSARYGGEGLDDVMRVELLLKNMENVPDEKRTARFVCALAYIDEKGELSAQGSCEGSIIREMRGGGGFGYDPVFFVEEYQKTLAEVKPDEKNAISHRGKALRAMAEMLKKER